MTAQSATAAAASPTAQAARLLAGISFALPWLLAIYIAYILAWYLPFKFAPDSHLFQVIEDWAGKDWVEPYFRYFTGAVEGVTILLLLVPRLQVLGAGMALVTMACAIGLHLFTPLGIDPYNDGGRLFTEACTNLVFAATILVIRRCEIVPLARYVLTDRRLARLTRSL